MKRVLEAIAARQARFAAQPFFKRLEGVGTVEEARAFAPQLTFFVMVFQDILRVNEAKVKDPALRKVARHHRVEDRGHDNWFLHDLDQLGVTHGIGWLFGPRHAATRDAAYALMSEVHRASGDHVRVALLLVLEATGDAFFSRIPGFMARAGFDKPLKYFSEAHHQVERNHEMFERRMQEELRALVVPGEVEAEALAMVERAFDTMEGMVAGFAASMERAASPAVA
ncbi:MAG: hypothetical protein AB2A00_11625 [Myxococcota bacterium]